MRVAVLGGGPAAAAAALELARGGGRPTLVLPERPGEKPCGGALPEFLLDEIDGFAADSLPAVKVRRAVLENAAGSKVDVDLSGLRIFRRADLDSALVEAASNAGAEVRREKARRLGWRAERPVLATDSGESSFDWIVAADGAMGLSRRSLGLESRGDSVGLGASLVSPVPQALVLGFPGVADAYLWIFPRPEGCSVGAAYSGDLLSTGAARSLLASFVERHLGVPFADLDGKRYRYPIPVFGPWTREALETAAERRILLAGDAAALADPLTREGIRYAVRSGRLAAECLLERQPEVYPRSLVESVAADLGRAERARELFYDAPIGQWMVPVCRRHPGVRRVLADLLACRQPYVGLRRRLLGAAVDLRGG